MRNLKTSMMLSIDVEDWFQVENFKRYISFSSWSTYELRVEKNIYRLLDLFDSIDVTQSSEVRGQRSDIPEFQDNYIKPAASICQQNYPTINPTNSSDLINSSNTIDPINPKATFFVLGWLAERLPHLVREIHSRGHEVASHGYSHGLCYSCSNVELHEDLSHSKKLLEDIIAAPVYGYRAPSFSINNDVLKVIEDCGYLYDSSYNSFGMHGRYGRLDLSNFQKDGIALRVSDSFYELPISNLQFSIFNLKSSIFNSVLPWGGGGYFRLIPFLIFKLGILSILKNNGAYLFYMHPWEIDHKQPRVNEASAFFKFRHYINLKNCQSKLVNLLNSFSASHFITCKQYITSL
jgi:peptidoglycan-N-acetylglucosamine deacetylase